MKRGGAGDGALARSELLKRSEVSGGAGSDVKWLGLKESEVKRSEVT